MRVHLFAAASAGLCLLSACGGGGDAEQPAAPAQGPAPAASAEPDPWTIPANAGLWAQSMEVNGRETPPMTRCYDPAQGPLIPERFGPPDPTQSCQPVRRTRTATGYVREETCTRDGVTQTARAEVTGDMRNEVILRATNSSNPAQTITTRYRRVGECPAGGGAGGGAPGGNGAPQASTVPEVMQVPVRLPNGEQRMATMRRVTDPGALEALQHAASTRLSDCQRLSRVLQLVYENERAPIFQATCEGGAQYRMTLSGTTLNMRRWNGYLIDPPESAAAAPEQPRGGGGDDQVLSKQPG